jgi:hypothetical protein
LRKPRHKADHPAAVAQGKPKIAIDRAPPTKHRLN